MKRNEQTYPHPFNESGHLTPGALEFYSDRAVPPDVQTHLDTCELCRDALEGFRVASPGDSHAEILRSMRLQLERRRFAVRRRLPSRQRNWKVPNWPYYIAVAASVLAIIGYFTFLPKPGEQASPGIAEQLPAREEVKPPEPPEAFAPAEMGETLREAPAPDARTKTPVPEKKEEPSIPAAGETYEATEDVTLTPSSLLSESLESAAPETDSLADLVILAEPSASSAREAELAQTESLKTTEEEALSMPAARSAKKISLAGVASDEAFYLPEGKFRIEMGGKEYLLSLEETELPAIKGDTLLPEFKSEAYKNFGEYLSRNADVPGTAGPDDLPLTVYVSFGIDRRGRVSGPEILGASQPGFDTEAIRLVRESPDWQPGKIQGNPAPSRVVVPVYFPKKGGS